MRRNVTLKTNFLLIKMAANIAGKALSKKKSQHFWMKSYFPLIKGISIILIGEYQDLVSFALMKV